MLKLRTEHRERVQRVASAVRARAGSKRPASLQKSAVSHFVPNPHDPRHKDEKIDVRALREILSIGSVSSRDDHCVAEPGVTFKELVDRTLPMGRIPKLVPELETITLGGAVAGCSVESMSYKHGGFHDSCLSYEIVTGEGEIVRTSRGEELFEMIHGSYGTLAILTELTFELIPAKPYVRMEYRTERTFDAFERAIHEEMARGVDFLDAIVHGKDALTLCIGHFEDTLPRGVKPSDYRWLDIFYKSTRRLREDWLTTRDYLFRYDTECHWLSRSLPVPFMESRPMRLALGKTLLGSTNLLTWAKRMRPVLKLDRHPDVVVDLFIPSRRFADFFAWYADTIDYWPLWVVPYRVPSPYPWISDAHNARMNDPLFIDCAIYGKKNDTRGVDWSEVLEQKTYELDGIKTLISRNHYTRERFWDIYAKDRYDATKARTDPHGLFRDLYEKFHYREG
jgi:FAD/FMN-containing dehydrogenase